RAAASTSGTSAKLRRKAARAKSTPVRAQPPMGRWSIAIDARLWAASCAPPSTAERCATRRACAPSSMRVANSLFDPIFAPFGDAVPPAFRDQFLLSPDDDHSIVLEGMMEVWRRPAWIAPLFWLLGAAGILSGQTGRNIPTTVTIRAGRDADGE